MKITFDTNVRQTAGAAEKPSVEREKRSRSFGAAFRLDYHGGAEREWEQTGLAGKRGKTARDIQENAQSADVTQYQNLMTVMSHCMSEEDYARLEKDGFRLEDLNPETAVTIMDKIKAEVARSGVQIAGFNDDLDLEVLAEAVGGGGLARAIMDGFREADIPATEENVSGTARAVEMASGLKSPDDGELRYMIDNGMEPQIRNIYLAENSGAGQASGRGPRYYADEVEGYYSAAAGPADAALLEEEAEKALPRLGFEDTEENRAAALWLLEKGLPLNKENMNACLELASVEYPVEPQRAARAAARAIAEGKDPSCGDLSRDESIYNRAARLLDYYFSPRAEEGLDLAGRRRLEEVRLRMTAEVNVKLLRSGFSIDTAPMEELIDALKAAERQAARQYFPEDADAPAKYEQFRDTQRAVQDIPGLPAALLGAWTAGAAQAAGTAQAAQSVGEAAAAEKTAGAAQTAGKATAAAQAERTAHPAGKTAGTGDAAGDDTGMAEEASAARQDTLARFCEEGRALRESFVRAGESYETLMTSPRKDMGDSISKAFANVDDILRDLGLELTEENRKAVRILGYNRMEITDENLDKVKAAERTVRQVTEKLTPAATLRMIRDGVNPLERSFEELQEYFSAQPAEYEEQADSYSRFLYGLEINKEITQPERESYIGVYRLLHQMERSDGAAVGALVGAGAELNFSNLLSAVRTRRAGRLDVKVDDEFGALEEMSRNGVSISEQIAAGYGETWKDVLKETARQDDVRRAFVEQETELLRQLAHSGSEPVSMLQRGQIPVTVGNLLAARALQEDGKSLFMRWEKGYTERKPAASDGGQAEDLSQDASIAAGRAGEPDQASAVVSGAEQIWDALGTGEALQKNTRTLYAQLSAEVEAATPEASFCVDVKGLRLLHRQLSIAGRLAGQEEYHIPVEIGGELTAVHLTVRQQDSAGGRVGISMELPEAGRVEGLLQVREGRISGYFTGKGQEAVTKLKSAADIFSDRVSEKWEVEDILVADGSGGKPSLPETEPVKRDSVGSDELYQTAKDFLAAVKTAFSRTE